MAWKPDANLATTPVVLVSPDENTRVTVHVAGISEQQYKELSDLLGCELNSRSTQAYIAVSNAMQKALELCPKANPADLWVHLIYHQYRNRYKKNDQSWKRVGGQAWEHTIKTIYNRRLHKAGITIRNSKGADAITLGLVKRGLGSSKTDLILEGKDGSATVIFGVIHNKLSIAERLTDDAPASVALIEQGYWSAIVTMDNKMFPPPHGEGIVYGELGITRTSDKRYYFEVAGQFSGCYSFNLRTPPSAETTASGYKIYSLSFAEEQPDALVRDIVAAWSKFQEKRKLTS